MDACSHGSADLECRLEEFLFFGPLFLFSIIYHYAWESHLYTHNELYIHWPSNKFSRLGTRVM
eukprot:SAG11_NODE_40361_length_203_cov_56.971154_1_plen_62_part_01